MDNEVHSCDIPSPSNEIQPTVQEQQERNEIKKKKSHGNRKAQRQRRRLRRQGIDPYTVSKMYYQNGTSQQQQQSEQNTSSTTNETIVEHSTAMIQKNEIIQQQFMDTKKAIKLNQDVSAKKKKSQMVTNDSVDCKNISDDIFIQMLSTAFHNTDKLNLLINQEEQILFIRQYTNLIDRLYCLQLQQSQWNYYHHIGITQNIWTARMAKHVAEKNSICHAYGRSKTFIAQRQKQIEKHLQQAQYAVQQFEQEIIIKMVQHGDYSFEMKVLFSIIEKFVQEKQRSIQYDYEYKREILFLDATDHQLIISARRIWQATQKQMIIEEDIALLEYRLTSTQLQSAPNLIENMINDIDARFKQSHQTAEQINEIKKLQDLKHDIIQQAVFTSRQMANDLTKIIEKEKKKFTLQNRFIQSTAQWQKLVLDAIDKRRQHMIKRVNFIIKHKLIKLSNASKDYNHSPS
ncbi:unnamed protein product [Adineta steineri]|uniref:Uncharacterized protein n=1 Tax=Adineta steineri TaxID=433720 RepID=A0A815HB44_9BILA|nr:unnamed protein product [Adineta steineri]